MIFRQSIETREGNSEQQNVFTQKYKIFDKLFNFTKMRIIRINFNVYLEDEKYAHYNLIYHIKEFDYI